MSNPSKINLDEVMTELPPWNLVLTIGGVDYPVRELRVADLKATDQMASLGEVFKFVEGLFKGKRPDIDGWSAEMLGVVIGAVTRYSAGRSAKNNQIASDAALSRVKPGGTPSNQRSLAN